MMEKRFAAAVAITLAVFSIFGCSNSVSQSPQTTQSATTTAEGSVTEATAGGKASSGADASADGGGKTFGITYWIESDFSKTVTDSITSAAGIDGNKTVVVDIQQNSTKQVQIIKDFIVRDMDAVFLNPVDRDAVTPALQELKGAGIPVTNSDSSAVNLDLIDAYVATDNLQAGKLCAEAMIKGFLEGGFIAVLDYPTNGAYLDGEKGFLGTIESKGFEVAATFDVEGTVEKGQSITSDILQAHPDTVAILSINGQVGMGVYAAYTTSSANVSVYGVDGTLEVKQVTAKRGNIYRMTVAQSPVKIGTSCYDVAMTILSGEKPAQFQIDVPTFTVGSTNIQDYLGAE